MQVCEEHHLALGNIWVQGDGNFLTTALRYQTFKGKENEEMHFFGERCVEFTFKKRQGMPGTSWATGEVLWYRDVQEMSMNE